MGGFTSPALALAVSRAGGLGMLTGNIGYQALSAQLDVVPVDLPIGVNFLVPSLTTSA
jgi:NAD(P)H-dependent flavin oxidoreductase YrpB (nitropropane dioxygenase family)